jgi:hypothetical protein
MLAGILLLGVGAWMITQKADNQLKFVEELLAQRRTIARTGKNTPAPAAKTEDTGPASADDTSSGFDDIDAV